MLCSTYIGCNTVVTSRAIPHPLQGNLHPCRHGRYTVFRTRSNMRIYVSGSQAQAATDPLPIRNYSPILSSHKVCTYRKA